MRIRLANFEIWDRLGTTILCLLRGLPIDFDAWLGNHEVRASLEFVGGTCLRQGH